MDNSICTNIIDKEELKRIILKDGEKKLFGIIKCIQKNKYDKPIRTENKVKLMTSLKALRKFQSIKVKDETESYFLFYAEQTENDNYTSKYIFGKYYK